jgi:tripartite-type tricarboxylate transporter receptor subunit TctC
MMLAVRSDAPYKTLHDLVEAARAAPGSIRISDSGLLGTPHSTALMLALASGVKFTYVHFGGGPPSVTALLGGHVEVLAGGISDALPQLRAGTFRILGLAAEARDANIPDVPTMREQGYDVLSASIGTLVAPAGTPPAILAKLTAAAKIVVADPDQAKKLADFGSAPYFNGPEAATRIWIDTETRVKPLLEQASGP